MTTQATHTPGPWEIGSINKRDKNLWWSAVFTPKSTGKFHAPRACDALGVDREEYEGNARLIAAAPDLLEALRGLIDQLEAAGIHIPGEDSGQWHGAEGLSFSRAIEAIAKAEGRAE